MVDDLVVPVELALIDQDRERGDGEGLAGRSGREDRVGIDRRGLADACARPSLGERRSCRPRRSRSTRRARRRRAQRLDALPESGRRRGAAPGVATGRASRKGSGVSCLYAPVGPDQPPHAQRQQRQRRRRRSGHTPRRGSRWRSARRGRSGRRRTCSRPASASAIASRARCSERSPRRLLQGRAIRSLIAWTAPAPLSSRAAKIISWNSRWNSGMSEPLEQEIGRQASLPRSPDRNAIMATKNSIAGSIASGPAISPATTASRWLVRCRMTGRITTAPMML